MRQTLAIAIILLVFPGCFQLESPLPRVWFYTYSSGPATLRDSLLTPASFLELRKDNTYTLDFGHFEYGKWNVRDQKFILTNQDHQQTIIPFELAKGSGLQLFLKSDTANFESQPLPGKGGENDPFSLENNRWRITAAHKESDQELRKRLYDHCRFWETYFTWALDNKIETIDVRSTPTVIKIYGNGFTLKPAEDLPAEWKSYFFDGEDCQKATDILTDIFRRRNIAWAHTDNKYKMFIGAFQQMESFLR